MLVIYVLCFCFTTLLAFDDLDSLFPVQDTSSQSPTVNTEALPLQLYKSDNVGYSIMQAANPLEREELSDHRRNDCPTTNILLKILNIVSNILQESSNMLEPGKLHYLLSIIRRFLEKIEITDENYNVNEHLNSLVAQLETTKTKYREKALRANEERIQAKASVQSVAPRSDNLECQNIFNILVKFVYSTYTQVAEFCKLTGKCDASILPFINFDKSALNANIYNQLKMLLQTSQKYPNLPIEMPYLSNLFSNLPKYEKDNTRINYKNPAINMDNNFILQNYLQNLYKNNAQDTQNAYPPVNPQLSYQENQGKYAKYQLSNLFTNKQFYGLKENPYIQQSPYAETNLNTLLNNKNEKYVDAVNKGTTNNFDNLKELPLKRISPYVNQNEAYTNINNPKKDLLKIIFKVPNSDKVATKDESGKFGLQQLIYSNGLPTNTQENERKQFSQIINSNVLSKLNKIKDNQYYVRNPVDSNANPLSILNYYLQNSHSNGQEQTNSVRQPDVVTKTELSQESNDDQNVSRYLYLYKQLLNQNLNVLGPNQASKDTLDTQKYINFNKGAKVITNPDLSHDSINDPNKVRNLYLYKLLLNQNSNVLVPNQPYKDISNIPELTNVNDGAEVTTKFSQDTTNNPNKDRSLYLYKLLLNQNSNLLGINQASRDISNTQANFKDNAKDITNINLSQDSANDPNKARNLYLYKLLLNRNSNVLGINQASKVISDVQGQTSFNENARDFKNVDLSQDFANDPIKAGNLYLYKLLLNQNSNTLGLNKDTSNVQEQTNLNKNAYIVTKTDLSRESDPNMSGYLHIIKQLLNPNTNILGLNHNSQNSLPGLNTLTSQGSYVSPNNINTLVRDNEKQENYVAQLPDSSHLLSVSNLIKLNPAQRNNRILELTYKLKRTKALYDPLYYVKYRIPYNDFLDIIGNLLKQNPLLRNQPQKIYEELLSGSNVIEASENLKDLNRDELVRLTSDNGTLIDAKILEDNDLKAGKQLKIIQDLNANLSFANLVNSNEVSDKTLKTLQNLLNTTIDSGYDSVKSNIYPMSDVRRLSLNSAYNSRVLHPSLNYNLYSKNINPYSAYNTSPNRYSYNTLSKTLVKNIPPISNFVNTPYVG